MRSAQIQKYTVAESASLYIGNIGLKTKDAIALRKKIF